MARKDKNVTPSVTQKLQDLGYNIADWDDSKTQKKLDENILKALSKASKKQNGKEGIPDRIFFKKEEKLIILVEEKGHVKNHDLNNIEKGCIEGTK